MTDEPQKMAPSDPPTQSRLEGVDLATDNGEAAGSSRPDSPASRPESIGRYRILRVLGQGGFGLVYLGEDEQLGRKVAIKVPHAQLVSGKGGAEAYLAEARTVAALEHPHIVPVYDVGATSSHPFFVVSKYIDGTDLSARLSVRRMTVGDTVGLVAVVGDALHFAHKRGIVHRDVKPGNILLDMEGRPFVGDFGLALREKDIGKGPRYAGTPAYMSPEQARGEGHRVDGRSDVFSLGVVLYQMLTGRLPFLADTQLELLEVITRVEAKPLRQWDDRIDRELERICAKALMKRVSDRYDTALDFADDLRGYLAGASEGMRMSVGVSKGKGASVAATPALMTPAIQVPMPATVPLTPAVAAAESNVPRIVPKGLRSFDEEDADFFLDLLPGPRDRSGMPEALRFWKRKIEETDPDRTFTVGLIYGPSGCGKSSLIKAGLLPRLSKDLSVLYVEATPEGTESRLLKELRKKLNLSRRELSLKETLAAIRQERDAGAGRKVLIILDQFEQWLSSHGADQETELAQALRQCDGEHVQAILMVRDDFWLAVSRFLQQIEVKLSEGFNSTLVDLFPLAHAKKVLIAFGRANGDLPEELVELSPQQKQFVERAVESLAQEGKVISVRLALFAEMMKAKAWTTKTLDSVGGAAGLGAVYLEEIFSAESAPAEHRYRQKAIRRVLGALLPSGISDIKGRMQTREELLQASGYAKHPSDFDQLILLLDQKLRLITPTDPEAKDGAEESEGSAGKGQECYQLTHDYLVPSIRQWLRRKKEETAQGRAELILEGRTAYWKERKENRFLPSLSEYARIVYYTQSKNRTADQNNLLVRAGVYYGTLALGLFATFALLASCMAWIYYSVNESQNRLNAQRIVEAIQKAETAKVPELIRKLNGFRKYADSILKEEFEKVAPQSKEKIHLALALHPVDPSVEEFLKTHLWKASPSELPIYFDSLEDRKGPDWNRFVEEVWEKANSPQKDANSRRLAVAAFLARFDPASKNWSTLGATVVDDLILENPSTVSAWTSAFLPVKAHLLPRLHEAFLDRGADKFAERSMATNLLIAFSGGQVSEWIDLLLESDENQFLVIYPLIAQRFSEFMAEKHDQAELIKPFVNELSQGSPDSVNQVRQNTQQNKLITRKTNAAAFLMRFCPKEAQWGVLKHAPNPQMRSNLVNRMGPLGVDPKVLFEKWKGAEDISMQRALVLALGEFSKRDLPLKERGVIREELRARYRTCADAGLHSSIEWLLRKWNDDDWLDEEQERWIKEKASAKIEIPDGRDESDEGPWVPKAGWHVNSQGQIMVDIPRPGQTEQGSPRGEEKRDKNESRHRSVIDRSFSISSKQVTIRDWNQLMKADPLLRSERFSLSNRASAHFIDWYMAAKYCNVLSKSEGLELCFEENEKGEITGLKNKYLSKNGYRMPTEAEMEYATRAGSKTPWCFGDSPELLGHYAWYILNADEIVHEPGLKKPNDFGLFDVHGNVHCWCLDIFEDYPTGASPRMDREGQLIVDRNRPRILRGGAYLNFPGSLRSAYRLYNVPTTKDADTGFRLARTLERTLKEK